MVYNGQGQEWQWTYGGNGSQNNTIYSHSAIGRAKLTLIHYIQVGTQKTIEKAFDFSTLARENMVTET